jgi:hypothetical protein
MKKTMFFYFFFNFLKLTSFGYFKNLYFLGVSSIEVPENMRYFCGMGAILLAPTVEGTERRRGL